MASDPTPLEYDDPFHHVEWGIATQAGEAVRMLDEPVARLATNGRDDLMLISREVVYHPWRVEPKT